MLGIIITIFAILIGVKSNAPLSKEKAPEGSVLTELLRNNKGNHCTNTYTSAITIDISQMNDNVYY